MATLATVELSRQEIAQLLALVKVRAAELDRMLQALDEGEGEDLQRHQARRSMRPQVELMSDLVLKLEGAAHDLDVK